MRSAMQRIVADAVTDAVKRERNTMVAILGAVLRGMSDDEIHERYGARQDQIDSVRAAVQPD